MPVQNTLNLWLIVEIDAENCISGLKEKVSSKNCLRERKMTECSNPECRKELGENEIQDSENSGCIIYLCSKCRGIKNVEKSI